VRVEQSAKLDNRYDHHEEEACDYRELGHRRTSLASKNCPAHLAL
jgi:hypothetical protein